MKLIAFLLCLMMLGTARGEELPVLTLPVPEGMVQATSASCGEAAALLDADEEHLREGLSADDVICLNVSPGGTLWQANMQKSGTAGLDFDTMGKKKAAILAQKLSRSSGQEAAVVKLHKTEPQPTLAPGLHHSSLWIRLTPAGSSYPRADTWITAIRGWELTVTCTWPSAEEEALYDTPLRETLWSLTLTLPES